MTDDLTPSEIIANAFAAEEITFETAVVRLLAEICDGVWYGAHEMTRIAEMAAGEEETKH